MTAIYLDNNSTTMMAPYVIQKMTHVLQNHYGNPSSAHSFGRDSRALIDEARRSIATYLGVKPREIIFTSSGTEAINLAIRGICQGHTQGHIVTSSVEHAAVFNTVQAMESAGWLCTFVAPGLYGAITADAIRAAITPNTALIAVMAVNNETGVKTDIDAIAALAEENGIPLFVDGVALLGKETFIIPSGVSMMAFGAHKLHGPKGIGCLVLRSRLKLSSFITGGGQESNLRAGTENVAAIVGFAAAVELLRTELPLASENMRKLRDQLEQGIRNKHPGVVVNGEGPRVVNTTNLAFKGVDGESLLINLDQAGVAVSHGSACTSGALEPSRILMNMGVSLELARSSMRFSLSRFTTQQDIERTIEIVCANI